MSGAAWVKESKCRSCGAAIYWTITATGKRMPVDAVPVVGGNVLVTRLGKARTIRETDVKAGDLVSRHVARCSPDKPCPFCAAGGESCGADGRNTYESHYATCPDAKSWRKGAT